MAAFQNPPAGAFGTKLPIIKCNAEIQRRDGVYGFKGCTRNATQEFRTTVRAGIDKLHFTMHYCTRHASMGAK